MNAPASLVSVKIIRFSRLDCAAACASTCDGDREVLAATRIPDLPRGGAVLVQRLEALLVLERVHRRPEAVVTLGQDLLVLHEPRERLVDQVLARSDVVDDLGAHD